MCGHLVISSRLPVWAPLALVARWYQEDACDKTSGEAVTGIIDAIIVASSTRRVHQSGLTLCRLWLG